MDDYPTPPLMPLPSAATNSGSRSKVQSPRVFCEQANYRRMPPDGGDHVA
jgi:hypothetical protein